jgi:hypothetical protein
MAALVNDVAMVSMRGAATEPDWAAAGAVEFAARATPAALFDAIARLLDDADRRREVAAAGRRLYQERFAIEHSVRELLSAGSAPA